jgi:PAS domain S-box-containing protein
MIPANELRLNFLKDEVFSILASMGEGIVISDNKHKVIFMNKAAEKLLEVKEEDFLGKSIWNCHHRRSIVEESMIRSKIAPVAYQAHCFGLNKTFNLSIAAVKGKGEKFKGTAMIIHDFTQEKKLNDELIASNTQLKLKQDKLDFQLKIAKKIQRGLLPANHITKDFAFWGEVQQTSEVGGDFYLYLPLSDNLIFIALVDIAGKGVPAALIMTRVMNYLSTAALKHIYPGAVLESLNKKILEVFKEELYSLVSLFALTLEPKSGKMWYAGAAFEAPVWLKAGGKVKLLESSGLALGTFSKNTYKQRLITLGPGDRIVIYSDGVIDARNSNGEFFGRKRWSSLLKTKAKLKGKTFLKALMQNIVKFNFPGPLNDDLSLLVLQKR